MPKPPPPPRKLEDQFVENVSRYPFYFVTVLLGGIWVGIKPFVDLYRKSPLSAVAVGLGLSLFMLFIHFTLRGMAGDSFFPEWILNRIPQS
ncbi:MAG: DUF751 family protein [Cyanobacteriota bacterium]|nr:DUF751 family protein [Cyanobacteriota bacterium]